MRWRLRDPLLEGIFVIGLIQVSYSYKRHYRPRVNSYGVGKDVWGVYVKYLPLDDGAGVEEKIPSGDEVESGTARYFCVGESVVENVGIFAVIFGRKGK